MLDPKSKKVSAALASNSSKSKKKAKKTKIALNELES